ncbi:MAG: pilus assembly protein [Clostridiales bacterium GWF2_36_10]|nr:MAG: pilus assembly protein [Clostridiales bacterium GWF2_36_10]HAN20187.1 Flp family type IVb pilin [Clostridiales bacterium]
MKNIKNFLKDENGQGMVEYGLIIGLIAIVVVAGLVILGPKIKDMFTNIADELTSEATSV